MTHWPIQGQAAPGETDLLALILVLWRKRRWLIAGTIAGTIFGCLLASQLVPRWSSEALIVPPLFSELQGQEALQEQLAGMGVEVPLGSDTWFTLFTEIYDAPLIQQAWQRQARVDELARVTFTRQSSQVIKNKSLHGYHYEVLTATAADPIQAQQALQAYIGYVSQAVNRELTARVLQAVQRHRASGHVSLVSQPRLAALSVQPYRLQEAPTLSTQRSSVKPQLVILLCALVSVLAAGLGIITHNALATYLIIQKRTIQEESVTSLAPGRPPAEG